MKNDASCPCEGSSLTGFIQPIILACLRDGPCHGYVLMQKISRTRLWSGKTPDAAGVYRALKDMEKRGHVESVIDEAERGSEKRVFSLTEQGIQCAKSWEKTLRTYRSGITEVIRMLGSLSEDFPDVPEESGCSCHKDKT